MLDKLAKLPLTAVNLVPAPVYGLIPKPVLKLVPEDIRNLIPTERHNAFTKQPTTQHQKLIASIENQVATVKAKDQAYYQFMKAADTELVETHKLLIPILFDELFRQYPQLNQFQWSFYNKGMTTATVVVGITVNHVEYEVFATESGLGNPNLDEETSLILYRVVHALFCPEKAYDPRQGVERLQSSASQRACKELFGKDTLITCRPGKITTRKYPR